MKQADSSMDSTSLFAQLDRYNVAWTTPGQTDRAAMPLGNGEVGVSLWVQAPGEIHFYIARTDARTECDRSVKLGKVRLTFSPAAQLLDAGFQQMLVLRDGRIDIQWRGADGNAASLQVFVDAEQPILYVTGSFAQPVTVQADYQTWRTAPRQNAPANSVETATLLGAVETADVVQAADAGIFFYHRNGPTIIPFLRDLEAVTPIADRIPDCLTDRIFGGLMSMAGAVPGEPAGLVSAQPVHTFTLQITTHSAQVASVEEWLDAIHRLRAAAPPVDTARAHTAQWWRDYWQQSWIFVKGDSPVQPAVSPDLLTVALEPGDDNAPAADLSNVTRAYVLTRWMFACMGRGHFPILYSGGLFNLMPGQAEHLDVLTFSKTFTAQPAGGPTLEFNPDERGWGHFYLWQNTRLPYASMLARGEADWLPALFNFYRRFWALDRARAWLYYRAEGQYNSEIVHSFGLMPAHVYGLDRRGKPDGYCENRWGGAVDLSPGLELLHLMLDFYDYQREQRFLHEELLPYARDLLRFIATRFPARRQGKMVIHPIQSVETYWDTTDSIPVVAGLHAVVARILALPPDHLPDRDFYVQFQALIPDMPQEVVDGKRVLAPAARYEPVRKNSESPAFYAVFPFRLFGVGKSDLALAVDSYHHAAALAGSRQPFTLGYSPEYPSYSGWQQHGMVAALLGLRNEARTILEHNCALANPGHRFPAMWGPIYDAVPDIDHGANILTTLQLMALQVEGSEIRLLPAWPEHWDIEFKLHAPQHTTVECSYRQGKIERLRVDPPERAKDVICTAPVNLRGDQQIDSEMKSGIERG